MIMSNGVFSGVPNIVQVNLDFFGGVAYEEKLNRVVNSFLTTINIAMHSSLKEAGGLHVKMFKPK